MAAGTAVALLTVVAAAVFLGGIAFDRLLVRREFRRLIKTSRSGETVLDAVRRRDSPDFLAADILRVYPGAGESEDFLKGLSWSPPPVLVPFVGSGPREGRSANATINRHHFRDARPDYGPKRTDEIRIFLTGGSVVYGSGAFSQEQTVAGFLEDALNREAGARGRKYVVVNTGVPGYSSTHERLLVELKLVTLQPDLVLMLSGGNDVHWAAGGFDVRDLRTYDDVHFDTVVSRAYRFAGFDWPELPPASGSIPAPAEVAQRLSENVARTARAAQAVGARVVFALQPNIHTSKKNLSAREKRLLAGMPGPDLWEPCYAEIRARLSGRKDEFTFADLSPAFENGPAAEEWFIDSYHFGSRGSRDLAARLASVVRDVLGPGDGGPGREGQ